MNETRLPEKLSDLIRVAVADMDKVRERSDKYKLDMDVWHSPLGDGTCQVCLAGSVMAMSLGADISKNYKPIMLDQYTNSRLKALDAVRLGYIFSAFDWLDIELPTHIDPERSIEDYDATGNYDKFKSDLLEIASDLATEGL